MSFAEFAVLTEDGQVMPCDGLTWAHFNKGRQRIIVQEELPGGYWISTVFLGLNHQSFRGPPLWFETMIFGPPAGEPDPVTGQVLPHGDETYMERYTTLQEALGGHEAAKRWFEHRRLEQREAAE